MAIVETATGRVRGRRHGVVLRFLGIPYGAPTSGANRFRPPRPAVPWTGVRNAVAFGSWAPQNWKPERSLTAGERAVQSEDCLTLNVWTPAADTGRRPVLVWLHGGSFIEGSGAAAAYDGGRLAARGDVVVVTCNYRLGLLGFAAHEEFHDEETNAAGNWGLLDQMAALRWVAGNIAGFGGDPNRVTVAGQSAGAMSICDLLTTLQAGGLFSRAIVQSGGPSARSMEQATQTLEWVLGRLGLDGPAQMREVPVAALLRAQRDLAAVGDAFATRPVVDGAVLLRHPLDAATTGETAPIPLVIGTTRDEVRFFYAGTPVLRMLREEALRARVAAAVGRVRSTAVIAAYRAAREARRAPTEPGDLLAAIDTDRSLRVPAMRLADSHAGNQPATYAYRFDFAAGDDESGACHGLDIPFVFGNHDAPGISRWIDWTGGARRLSQLVQDAWLAWARGECPGPPGLGDWPRYEAGRRATMILAEPCQVIDAPDEAERAVWLDSELRV
jgi:para-nitrobenzyl esterase